AGEEIIVAELDRRDDHTYDDIARLDRYLLTRSGDGLGVVTDIVAAKPAERPRPAGRQRTPARPRAQQNPLTPFKTEELAALGLDGPLIELVRTLGEGVDVAD